MVWPFKIFDFHNYSSRKGETLSHLPREVVLSLGSSLLHHIRCNRSWIYEELLSGEISSLGSLKRTNQSLHLWRIDGFWLHSRILPQGAFLDRILKGHWWSFLAHYSSLDSSKPFCSMHLGLIFEPSSFCRDQHQQKEQKNSTSHSYKFPKSISRSIFHTIPLEPSKGHSKQLSQPEFWVLSFLSVILPNQNQLVWHNHC